MYNDMILYLKSKYNYEDYLLQILDKIYPAFIEVFGKENENLIKHRFLNTRIVIYNSNNEDETIAKYFPNERILVQGEAGQLITIFDDLYSPKHAIRIKTDLLKDDQIQLIATITHELVHSIVEDYNPKVQSMDSRYGKIYSMIEKSGIVYRHNIFNENSKKNNLYLNTSDSKCRFHNAEEGLTELTTVEIMKKAFNIDLEIKGTYKTYMEHMKKITPSDEIKHWFNQMRLVHFNRWWSISKYLDDYLNFYDLDENERFEKYSVMPKGYHHRIQQYDETTDNMAKKINIDLTNHINNQKKRTLHK